MGFFVVVVGLNKLLHKQWIFQWFQMPWCSCDVIVSKVCRCCQRTLMANHRHVLYVGTSCSNVFFHEIMLYDEFKHAVKNQKWTNISLMLPAWGWCWSSFWSIMPALGQYLAQFWPLMARLLGPYIVWVPVYLKKSPVDRLASCAFSTTSGLF